MIIERAEVDDDRELTGILVQTHNGQLSDLALLSDMSIEEIVDHCAKIYPGAFANRRGG